MSVLWRLGSATVTQVKDDLDEPLAYTSVLSALQTLEEKGYVRHEAEGRAYRYFPAVEAEAAGGSAIGLAARAGSAASKLWSVITAIRSPGSFSSALAKGFLMLGSDGMPAEQPARLTASEAARHTRQKWRSFPRIRIGPNVEPPSV